MELKTISKEHIPYELRQSHALYSQNDGKFVILGTDKLVYVIEPKYSPLCVNPYSLSIQHIEAPSGKPTIKFEDLSRDLNAIYSKANLFQKQTFLIDALYSSAFTLTPVEPVVNSICWPPKRQLHDKTLMVSVVSSYGACEIRTKYNEINNEWTSVVADINEVWSDYQARRYDSSPLNEFSDIEEYVNANHITTTCWSDCENENDCWTMFASNAAGTIIVFKISFNEGTVVDTYETGLAKICRMKFFSYTYKGKTDRLIIVTNVEGKLKLLRYDSSECSELADLWTKNDKMRCQSFEMYYCPNKQNLIVISSKGAHLLIFVLAGNPSKSKFKLTCKKAHLVGNMAITGLQMLKPYEYIVCAINGFTEHIRLTLEKDDVTIQTSPIRNDLESEHYQILGLACTVNQAGWIFLMYPCKNFDSLHKKPALITVCCLSSKDPLDIMIHNPRLSIRNMFDCAETIRCMFLRNLETEKYLTFSTDPVQLNIEFCYTCKIAMILAYGKIMQSRKNSRYAQTAKYEAHVTNLRTIIIAVNSYLRLFTLVKLGNLSTTQHLSGMYMRKYLMDFMNAELTENETHIQRIFMPLIGHICEEAEDIGRGYTEKCQYCDRDVNLETQTCDANHELQRCCITFLQVPLFSKRQCSQCKNLAMDDESMLREIIFDGDISCPVCEIPLVVDITEDYTPIKN